MSSTAETVAGIAVTYDPAAGPTLYPERAWAGRALEAWLAAAADALDGCEIGIVTRDAIGDPASHVAIIRIRESTGAHRAPAVTEWLLSARPAAQGSTWEARAGQVTCTCGREAGECPYPHDYDRSVAGYYQGDRR